MTGDGSENVDVIPELTPVSVSIDNLNELSPSSLHHTSNAKSNTTSGSYNGNGNPMKTVSFEDSQFYEKKTSEILSCLNGIITSPGTNHDENEERRVVDLWHLRQLALTRGGLVNPRIRRQAWAKLLGIDEHILSTSNVALPFHSSASPTDTTPAESQTMITNIELTKTDLEMIRQDVKICSWNVESNIKQLQRQKDKDYHHAGSVKKVPDDCSIGSLASGISILSAGKLSPLIIPQSIRAFPRFGYSNGTMSPSMSGSSTPLSGVMSPAVFNFNNNMKGKHISIHDGDNSSIVSSSSKGSFRSKGSLRVSSVKKNKEIKLLMNIIVSILRTPPNDNSSDTENRLYYFQGLQDIVAIILINIESPSLTSLIISQLAKSHFRDAMMRDFKNVRATLKMTLLPLLEFADKELHDHLVKLGLGDVGDFGLSWVIAWFAHDMKNFDVVSRLFDAFIVSHPIFPFYVTVAFITHPNNRSRIMDINCDKRYLQRVLMNLLKSMPSSHGNFSETIEEVIDIALSYMRDVPPSSLFNRAKNYHHGLLKNEIDLLPLIKVAQESPAWSLASFAPTDWSLIKQSRSLRGLSPVTREGKRQAFKKRLETCRNSFKNEYDRAIIAAGTQTSVVVKSKYYQKYSIVFFIFAAFAISSYFLSNKNNVNNLGNQLVNHKSTVNNIMENTIIDGVQNDVITSQTSRPNNLESSSDASLPFFNIFDRITHENNLHDDEKYKQNEPIHIIASKEVKKNTDEVVRTNFPILKLGSKSHEIVDANGNNGTANVDENKGNEMKNTNTPIFPIFKLEYKTNEISAAKSIDGSEDVVENIPIEMSRTDSSIFSFFTDNSIEIVKEKILIDTDMKVSENTVKTKVVANDHKSQHGQNLVMKEESVMIHPIGNENGLDSIQKIIEVNVHKTLDSIRGFLLEILEESRMKQDAITSTFEKNSHNLEHEKIDIVGNILRTIDNVFRDLKKKMRLIVVNHNL